MLAVNLCPKLGKTQLFYTSVLSQTCNFLVLSGGLHLCLAQVIYCRADLDAVRALFKSVHCCCFLRSSSLLTWVLMVLWLPPAEQSSLSRSDQTQEQGANSHANRA